MLNMYNNSPIGRLLIELSWAGRTIKRMRNGGIGYENVLTTEVMEGLNYLPRELFLGEIIKEIKFENNSHYNQLIHDFESFDILPHPVDQSKQYFVEPNNKIEVQPDAIITNQDVLCLVEAKGFGSSSFQEEQLAREYLLTIQEAKKQNKIPFLFLFIDEKPPVKVKKIGEIAIYDAISNKLGVVLSKSGNSTSHMEFYQDKIKDIVGWITWEQIKNIVDKQLQSFNCESESLKNTVKRIANSIIYSIEIHSKNE
ncbi:hypothetical protein ACFLSQ_04110 [Bacteroidota bacterium]